MFVGWRAVYTVFRGLIWVTVPVLGLVIPAHRLPAAPAVHNTMHTRMR